MFKRPRAHKVLTACVPILLIGLFLQAPFTSGALASCPGSDNRPVLNIANLTSPATAMLGAWQMTTPLLSGHADFGGLVARSNDHVYVVSGCGSDCMMGGASSDVEGAPILANGDIGPWQQLTPLVAGQGTPTVVVGNYLYAVGVARAAINADGSLGQWTPVNPPTTTGFRPAAAVVGNYIYVLGGWGSNPYNPLVNSVERAMVNGDGTLGPWESAPSMVVARFEFAAFAAGNYLFALGGESQQNGNWSSQSSIERAAIQPDGSLGAWEIIGRMPAPRHAFAAVYADGDLYVLGGNGTAPCTSIFYNTVDKATVNSDGTISNWQSMPPMLAARNFFGAVATDSYLYAIGGWTSGSGIEQLQTVERAAFPRSIYLPLIQSSGSGPSGIHGRVTLNGAAAVGVLLDLRFYNGSAWSTQATVATGSNGTYAFAGVPGLAGGQKYSVRYINPAPGANYNHRLAAWYTRDLTTYSAGGSVNIGNFDIADIELTSPASGATVAFPATFQWTRRSNSPSDSYELNLYDDVNPATYWWTDPPLGYVSSYTLNCRPGGFKPSTQYLWYVAVYSPDGGYGESFWARYVTFPPDFMGPSIQHESQPMPRNALPISDEPRH